MRIEVYELASEFFVMDTFIVVIGESFWQQAIVISRL